MNKTGLKYIDKLFYDKWIIGIFRGDIKEIIRKRNFDPDVNWLTVKPYSKYYADPFILSYSDNVYKILLEEFSFTDDYGKISLMTLDNDFRILSTKTLLDTFSHLSYPFIFKEDNRVFVFPEAGQSGKLSCYEYHPDNESLGFLCNIIDLPLVDASILKHNNKYWIFGTKSEMGHAYKLYVFFSDHLLGPYIEHSGNPIKSGKDGTRPAGDFIEVDGNIYRPTQNCTIEYGESMTINKIKELDEFNFIEEPYLELKINTKNRHNDGLKTMHTINVMDNIIVVDGIISVFSPRYAVKRYLRNRKKTLKEKI